jgi:GGDEF domain-containing protein
MQNKAMRTVSAAPGLVGPAGETQASLERFRKLLGHLQGELSAFEQVHEEILRAFQQVEHEAQRDDLTGLFRRKPFFERARALLEASSARGRECGLLLIDIDHFKRINDRFGHAAGDEVIRSVASLLLRQESLGALGHSGSLPGGEQSGVFASGGGEALAARLGGEEFVLLIPAGAAQLRATAELIRAGVESRVSLFSEVAAFPDSVASRQKQFRCTVSVGLATTGSCGFDAHRLLLSADQALYRAKGQGRNQVCVA